MKRILTFRFLICNIAVFYIAFFVYIVANQVFIHTDISLDKSIYNNNFSIAKAMDEIMNDINKGTGGTWLSEDNEKFLLENKIWIQILNEDNCEVYAFNKPKNMPKEYMASDLISYTINPWGMPSPAILNSETLEKDGERYSLIVAFPTEEVKVYSVIFTNDSLIFHLIMVMFVFVLMIVVAYIFSRKLADPIAEIIDDIDRLKQGNYKEKNKKRSIIYESVTNNIQELSFILRRNEEEEEKIHKAKEQWIANIAHDIKNPLSAINGYSQILESRDYELMQREINEYGRVIGERSQCIEELIEELSLIYKIKNKVMPFKIESKNIVNILRECVIDILNNPEYEHREIELAYEDEEILCFCDEKYIRRAFDNLIYNALKYNPKDTIVRIDVRRSDRKALIKVIDNGQGINEDDLKVLFERYYRGGTSKHKEGTGLGMAISKEIIESHGGKITVKSEIGKGTEIQVQL